MQRSKIFLIGLGVFSVLALMAFFVLVSLIGQLRQTAAVQEAGFKTTNNQSQEIINKLPQDNRIKNVQKILNYDEDTAGGLMTTEFITVLPDSTVSQAIEEIKNVSPNFGSIHYIYVTDSNGKFLGVISIRNLIIAKSDQRVREIMRSREKLPVASANQGVNSLASLMTKYNLLSVAVVDQEKKILGVVTVDDIMRRLIPDA